MDKSINSDYDLKAENDKLKEILIQLNQNYTLAIREAWINGFESGCGKTEEAKQYSGNHFANSRFRKDLKS